MGWAFVIFVDTVNIYNFIATCKFFSLGTFSKTLKIEELNVISKEDCNEQLRFNASSRRNSNATFHLQLPGGIDEFKLCSLGNYNATTDSYTVSSKK